MFLSQRVRKHTNLSDIEFPQSHLNRDVGEDETSVKDRKRRPDEEDEL
jgi:hypothetical protein